MIISYQGAQSFKVQFGDTVLAFDPVSKKSKFRANNFGADILICDDAFQHRRLYRDINIVLLDSGSPLGNGHLLPRGSLREPAAALSRASMLIATRSAETEKKDDPNTIKDFILKNL